MSGVLGSDSDWVIVGSVRLSQPRSDVIVLQRVCLIWFLKFLCNFRIYLRPHPWLVSALRCSLTMQRRGERGHRTMKTQLCFGSPCQAPRAQDLHSWGKSQALGRLFSLICFRGSHFSVCSFYLINKKYLSQTLLPFQSPGMSSIRVHSYLVPNDVKSSLQEPICYLNPSWSKANVNKYYSRLKI